MASLNPDLYEQIEMVVRRMMAHYFAPMPARVTSVSSDQLGNTRADIQPLFNFPRVDRETLERTYVKAPIIRDAPVLLPSSAASDQGLKLVVGDVGLWIPTMYSLDDLLDTDRNEPVDVTDVRQQALQDGFFLPMRWNRTLEAEAKDADRFIGGQDVRAGVAQDAASLAFKQSVQDAIDAVWDELAKVSNEIKKNAADVGTGNYVRGDKPIIAGTSHFKGS